MKQVIIILCLLLISCRQENNVVSSENLSQKASIENRQNSQENGDKRHIQFLFPDSKPTEEEKNSIPDIVKGAITLIASNREELGKFYDEKELKIILTKDIKKVAEQFHVTIPSINGITGIDSFCFDRSVDGKIEYFIILDQRVFDSYMKLVVTLNYATIYAKNFVNETGKEDFLDQEIKTFKENINDLQDLHNKLTRESNAPQMAEQLKELKELISKEQDSLKAYQNAKILNKSAKSTK